MYEKSNRNLIKDWIKCTGDTSAKMVIYCVTAEVRSRRPKFQHKVFGNKTEVIEEMIINDFGKYCRWVELVINTS